MNLSNIGNETVVKEILNRFHSGIFVGRDIYAEEPYVTWKEKTDPYSVFYLLKYLRYQTYQHYKEVKKKMASIPENNPPVKEKYSLITANPEAHDIEFLETKVLIENLKFRYPTFALALIRPNIVGNQILREGYWQGQLLDVMGHVTYAEEAYEDKIPLDGNPHEVIEGSLLNFDDSDCGFACWIAENNVNLKTSGSSKRVLGFANYVASQIFRSSIKNTIEKKDDFDFDG